MLKFSGSKSSIFFLDHTSVHCLWAGSSSLSFTGFRSKLQVETRDSPYASHLLGLLGYEGMSEIESILLWVTKNKKITSQVKID